MNCKIVSIFQAILLSYCLQGFSQSLTRGTVVMNNNDTLNGLLRYREYLQQITFRSSISNYKIVVYTPAQISSFVVKRTQYLRSRIKRCPHIVESSHRRTNLCNRPIIDSVFLEVLETGPNMSLYGFYDHEVGKTRFFMKLGDGKDVQEFEWPMSAEYLQNVARIIGFKENELSVIKYAPLDDLPDLLAVIKYMNHEVNSPLRHCGEPNDRSWLVTAAGGYCLLQPPTNGGSYNKYTGISETVGIGLDMWTGDYFTNVVMRLECQYYQYIFQPLRYNGVSASATAWLPIRGIRKIRFSPGVSLNGHYNHFSAANIKNVKAMFNETRRTAISMSVKARVSFNQRWEVGCGGLIVNTMTVDPFLVNPFNYYLFAAYHLKRIKRYETTN